METLTTRIFLDGGDPEETKLADELLKKAGHPGLGGQTTNPSLIAKNLRMKNPDMFLTEADALEEYRRIVMEMAKVTRGPISIQVTGDASLSSEQMLSEARARIQWIPNGVIKFPCTAEGLKAASVFCEEGPLNMTLVFSQEQAAAVYAATLPHGVDPSDKPYEVFLSPFVGRLDDRGEDGMQVVANILSMYRGRGDGHVSVLTASVRSMDHLLYALFLKSDVVTVPFTILKEWTTKGCPLPDSTYVYPVHDLTEIPYQELSLENDPTAYDLTHPLTAAGVEKFWSDWQQNINK